MGPTAAPARRAPREDAKAPDARCRGMAAEQQQVVPETVAVACRRTQGRPTGTPRSAPRSRAGRFPSRPTVAAAASMFQAAGTAATTPGAATATDTATTAAGTTVGFTIRGTVA